MELFYSAEIYPTHLFLSEEESRHCIRVLRKTTGETVKVIDGKGNINLLKFGLKIKLNLKLPHINHYFIWPLHPLKMPTEWNG
jgi:16S rRNA U1498 N3-methylase RsmE